MKRCLPSGKSKDSARVSASGQSPPHVALNTTLVRVIKFNNVILRRPTPTNARKIKSANYVYLQTNGVVTWEIPAMPQEKLKNALSNY